MHSQKPIPFPSQATYKIYPPSHIAQSSQKTELQKQLPTNPLKRANTNRSGDKMIKIARNSAKNGNLLLFNSSGSSTKQEYPITLVGKSKTLRSTLISHNQTMYFQTGSTNLESLKIIVNNKEQTPVLGELQKKVTSFNNTQKFSGRNQSECPAIEHRSFFNSEIQEKILHNSNNRNSGQSKKIEFKPIKKANSLKKKISQEIPKQQVSNLHLKNLSGQSNTHPSSCPINKTKDNYSQDSNCEIEDLSESKNLQKSNSQPKLFNESSPKQHSIVSCQDSQNSKAFVHAALKLDFKTQSHRISLRNSQENSPDKLAQSPDIIREAKLLEKNLANQAPLISKTPSEVFHYKLQSSNANKGKSNRTIFEDSNQTSKSNNSLGKTQVLTSNNNQPKLPKTQQQDDHTIIEGSSIPESSQIEFDALNINFLLNSQTVPPNTTSITFQQQSALKPLNLDAIRLHASLDTENNVDLKTNIQVVARFRPLNKLENELTSINNSNAKDIYQFSSDLKAVKINEEYCCHSTNNLTFTFDQVFQENVSQQAIFERIGQQKIVDIMNGYNGTIFAYGQTGSGKTYTMYGQDIFDEILMGIVPRAARQIFSTIKSQDLEVEYQIKVSMVEIYKETLRDLLHDSPEPAPDLKIKEDSKRGTYVEGLNQICIVSEEEIMTVLRAGETIRHVASTHLNQVSSRSHSICIIEVVQKYPNDSEKKGVLNLVDLAGSERVSKSHARGQALEEAKKINFSLSMLGKVISSLTKHSQHIPYRDSKLTRLLKESLGGNNKTTLLVACSMHQSNLEETLSSLRFAQSAKFIQNKVKMNIKSSSEQLQSVINQLKFELMQAKDEIYRLRVLSLTTVTNQVSNQTSSQKQEGELLFKICETADQQDFEIKPEAKKNNDSDSNQKHQILHNRPHQSLLAKNYDVIETNNQKLISLTPDISIIPQSTGTPNFTSPIKNYEIRLTSLIRKNEELEMLLQSKEQDIEALKCQKEELSIKVTKLEDKVIIYKQKLLTIEKQLADLQIDKDQFLVSEIKQDHKMEEYQSQIQILNSQLRCLQKALEDSDVNCQQLLKEKQQMNAKSFKDFMKDTLKFNSVCVSQTLESYIADSQTPNNKISFIQYFDIEQEFMHSLSQSKVTHLEVSLNDKDLLKLNLYAMDLVNAVEEGSVPPEILIYLLKQLLIEASLANHNLQRALSINRWRQVIEFGKNKVKSELCKIQETTIETLGSILEKSRGTHDKLRERIEKLENHLYDNRNYYGDIIQLTEGNQYHQKSEGKIQRLNTVQGVFNTFQQQLYLQNAGSLTNCNRSINQKSRFIRTITNKTLGKGFPFGEKSPQSRQSMHGGNISILSHYYGQNKIGTPQKTQENNSPQINNYQSPIRKQGGGITNVGGTFPQMNLQIQPFSIFNKAGTTGENQNFEDALQKFFVTNEKDEKTAIFQIIQQDIQAIEQMTSVEEIKQYFKYKYQPEKLNLFPMFVQYQNGCQSQQSSNINASNIHNSVTNNNNLYASSNKDYYGENTAPFQNLDVNNVHQRQEHVLSLQSEYMLTSNSAIYPQGLFNNGLNQYYQNDYLDRLQEKIVQLQEEVETQKCRTEEHKKAYYESKRQIEQIRELMEDKESKLNKIMKQEIYQWENVVKKLKKMNEAELQKKQSEIQKLHELLAQWIDNYQDLEVNKGVKQKYYVEKLLIQTLKHRKNKSSSSGNLDFLARRSNMLSSQTFLSKNVTHRMQFESMRVNRNQSNQMMNGTQENNTMDSNSVDKTKSIKGDNSPIDSCLELDQSHHQENSELFSLTNLMQRAYFSDEDDDVSTYKTQRYTLVQKDVQKKHILDRIDKTPKILDPSNFDALYKIVLLGESSTGKTSMLVRFAENEFIDNYKCTMCMDFKIKTAKVDDKIVKVQVWDTAGSERFRSLSQTYFRNSHGCIAVYDIASRKSFLKMEEQILNFIDFSPKDAIQNIILVGNKSDLSEKRQVTFYEAAELARKLNLAAVFECSAKENDNIDDAFFRCIVNCIDIYGTNHQQQNEKKSVVLKKSALTNNHNHYLEDSSDKKNSFERQNMEWKQRNIKQQNRRNVKSKLVKNRCHQEKTCC